MIPGLMIAAPASGAGKTTLTLGLIRALAQDGLIVQPFKNGPDYIDPAFHAAAAGRPSFNLDTWAMQPGMLAAIAAQAHSPSGAGADASGAAAMIAIAEGSMGLMDGVAQPGASGVGSGAELARAMGWPVVLVLDAAGQAQSAAAVALGFVHHPHAPPIAGVILNRIASPRHERLVRAGLEVMDIPVLGVLPRRPDLTLPERHLGLVQATEHADLEARLNTLAEFVRAHVDLAALRAVARPGPVGDPGHLTAMPRPPAQRIALARDQAFAFIYPHHLAGWRAAGAEVLPFSPLGDEAPDPTADLVWLPGGYPELHAGRLAAASNFKSGLARHAQTRPVHGECGGYMVLGSGLVDADGGRHEMTGLLGLVTSYAQRRLHLGYRAARLLAPMPGHAAGARLRGHEFHYSSILAQPDAPLARVTDAEGTEVVETGSVRGTVSGSFFHLIAEDA
jgi:cobyrinic acid a,c-diamide synthase